MSTRIRGSVILGIRTRDDGSRTCLRTVGLIAVLDPISRVVPSYSLEVAVGRAGRKGGGDEETRTPDPLLAKEMLFQLSYVPVLTDDAVMVGVSGLEPEASALSGQCSNQLS
jgi:hypothetical protein